MMTLIQSGGLRIGYEHPMKYWWLKWEWLFCRDRAVRCRLTCVGAPAPIWCHLRRMRWRQKHSITGASYHQVRSPIIRAWQPLLEPLLLPTDWSRVLTALSSMEAQVTALLDLPGRAPVASPPRPKTSIKQFPAMSLLSHSGDVETHTARLRFHGTVSSMPTSESSIPIQQGQHLSGGFTG
jgi:hypothetical protein